MARTVKQMVAEAEAAVEALDPQAAAALLGREDVQFVDLREKGELRREGEMPGAINVPRGLLEFWIDPESPYFNPALSADKKLVFFCALGWRSALATRTVQEMGFANVCHIAGGFTAWREAGGEIKAPEPRRQTEVRT